MSRAYLTPQSNVQNPDLDSEKHETDFFAEAIHELDVQELGYVKLPLLEEYYTALGVAEQYEKILGIDKKMAFWDNHPNVFGRASVIVFDKLEKEYWGHHGQSRYNVIGDLERKDNCEVGVSRPKSAFNNLNPGEEIIGDRYKIVCIYPTAENEFWPFVEWCIPKCRVRSDFTIMEEERYWKEIRNHLFPQQYLSEQLEYSEKFYKSVHGLSQSPPDICSEALAKKYFFSYGIKDAAGGYTVGAASGTTPYLFTVFYNIHTCPLQIYGEIFFQYYNGYRTTVMVAFFREQKERLNKGENIKFPVSETTHQTKSTEGEPVKVELQVKDHTPLSINKITRTFPELLAADYSETDLNRLLFHLRMRNENGQCIWPQKQKSGICGVISALSFKNYLIKTSKKEALLSLSLYLGLNESRVKEGYSKIQDTIKTKALSFLNQPIGK